MIQSTLMQDDQERYTHLDSSHSLLGLGQFNDVEKGVHLLRLPLQAHPVPDPLSTTPQMSYPLPVPHIRRGILYERKDLGNGHWSQSWKENEDQVTGQLGGRYNHEL
jgi:hypothetical protein